MVTPEQALRSLKVRCGQDRVFDSVENLESDSNRDRIWATIALVPKGRWTNYATVGEVVYGHLNGGQPVGNIVRGGGGANGVHRVLTKSGTVSASWQGPGGGPEECIRLLRREGTWDEGRSRAREERFISAAELRAE